jgi:hypothetical protein
MSKNAAAGAVEERRRSAATRTKAPLARVTVNLTSRSTEALEGAVAITGDSQTDTINRALQVYAYLERILKDGGAVYTRDAPDQELVSLRFF